MCEYIDMLEARGEARGIQKGEAIGIQKGEAAGKIKGENRLADLIQRLLRDKKYDDISLAASDSGRRQELYRLYNI